MVMAMRIKIVFKKKMLLGGNETTSLSNCKTITIELEILYC